MSDRASVGRKFLDIPAKFPKIPRFNDLLRSGILVPFRRYEENIASAISRINDKWYKYVKRRSKRENAVTYMTLISIRRGKCETARESGWSSGALITCSLLRSKSLVIRTTRGHEIARGNSHSFKDQTYAARGSRELNFSRNCPFARHRSVESAFLDDNLREASSRLPIPKSNGEEEHRLYEPR